MKRLISALSLASILGTATNLPLFLAIRPALAQPAASDGLFYIYNGERIPLTLERTAIAAKSKGTRGANDPPFATGLQQFLGQQNSQIQGLKTLVSQARSAENLPQVQPVGLDYATITATTQSGIEEIKPEVQRYDLTEQILPVLNLSQSGKTLILPNEIIVSFEQTLSESQIQATLNSQNLEILRPIAYSPNYFVVRSTADAVVSSLKNAELDSAAQQILAASDQIRQAEGVTAVTPNFIPAGTASFSDWLNQEQRPSSPTTSSLANLENPDGITVAAANTPSVASLFPWQWNLDSTPLTRCAGLQTINLQCLSQLIAPVEPSVRRTDMRAPEAWKISNRGRGVVVAVIDSLIQTNHPDLKNSLHKVDSSSSCPGEVSGWDYSSPNSISKAPSSDSASQDPCLQGDADPAISANEIDLIADQNWKNSFLLSDSEILRTYRGFVQQDRQSNRCSQGCSDQNIAKYIKEHIHRIRIAQFHGTMVSGVIAARPDGSAGLTGVAPQSEILPIRAAAINSEGSPNFSSEALIASIAYATQRNADVVNMSLGGNGQLTPSDPFKVRVEQALKDHPKLVIVASSGNDADANPPVLGKVGFPAGIDEVVAVGATNLYGERSIYSQYGQGLDVVAPGGDVNNPENLDTKIGGILTTGGTFIAGFWDGLPAPTSRWSPSIYDNKGKYVWTQGTSFSSPAVAGVFALMIGEDPQRKLTRDQLVGILKQTASYNRLKPLTQAEITAYNTAKQQGQTTATSAQEYYFGAGLVDAAAAVTEVKRVVQGQ